jgi:hypothetical protein
VGLEPQLLLLLLLLLEVGGKRNISDSVNKNIALAIIPSFLPSCHMLPEAHVLRHNVLGALLSPWL